MKYAVVGAGAVGAALGAFFAKAGRETWFIDPFEAHMKAIEENGLKMVYPDGNEEVVRVKTTTDAKLAGKADVVLLMVKGIHTEGAVESLKELADENTIILTLQNGYGNVDILKKYFPAEQIGYGMTTISSSMIEPGVVRPVKTGKTDVIIGGENKDDAYVEKLKAVVADMEKGECLAEYSDDIDVKIWTKIVTNLCANALCAITRLKGRPLYAQQEAIDIMIQMIRETCTVAQAKGIDLLPRKVTATFLALPEETSWVRDVYPSMAQDVMNKRKTEIDFLQGAIAQEGKKLGIPTPYCDCVHKLLKVIENTYEKQF